MRKQHDTLTLARGLREFYQPDNAVGVALDGLIADLQEGKLRKKSMRDAKAVLQLVGGTSRAHRIINQIISELS